MLVLQPAAIGWLSRIATRFKDECDEGFLALVSAPVWRHFNWLW